MSIATCGCEKVPSEGTGLLAISSSENDAQALQIARCFLTPLVVALSLARIDD